MRVWRAASHTGSSSLTLLVHNHMRFRVFGPDSVHKQVVVLTVSVLFGSGGGRFDIHPYHPSLWRNDPKVPKFGFDHVPFAEVNEITDAVSFSQMKPDKFSSLVNQQGHSGLFARAKLGLGGSNSLPNRRRSLIQCTRIAWLILVYLSALTSFQPSL